MSRDPRLLLEDILLACDRIMAYTQGMDREAFGNDPRTVDAVLRNLDGDRRGGKTVTHGV